MAADIRTSYVRIVTVKIFNYSYLSTVIVRVLTRYAYYLSFVSVAE